MTEIRADNIDGRRDNVIGLLNSEGFTGEVKLDYCDERFKCSCCSRAVCRNDKRSTGMYVDSQGMVWCRSCWVKCIDWTVRALKKNPDDASPKYIHRGGKYYQRIVREKFMERTFLCNI